MTIEELLKNEIENQYGSIYNFCKTTGLSRSMFTRIASKGLSSASNVSLNKIAKHLGLNFEDLKNGKIVYREYTPEEIKKFEQEEIRKIEIDQWNPLERELVDRFRELNVNGQFKVLEYMKDIKATYKAGE